jgi:hypothetical protein
VRQKVYIETTIPRFYYNTRKDSKHRVRQEWTRKWWDNHRFETISTPRLSCWKNLRPEVIPTSRKSWILHEDVKLFRQTPEIEEIAEVYRKHLLMPKNNTADAYHLAFATYHKCDILLTWNCIHLANTNKMAHIRRINAMLGLETPLLTTPLQLMGEDYEF